MLGIRRHCHFSCCTGIRNDTIDRASLRENLFHPNKNKSSINHIDPSLSLFNFKMKKKDEEKENKKYRLSETRQDLNFDENVVKINLHQYSTDYFSRKYKNCEYSCDDGHERQTLLSQHKLFPSCKEA